MFDKINKNSNNIEKGEKNEKKTKLEEKIEEVRKKGIEEIINEKELTFVDKINNRFNKLVFFELTQEEKTEVALKVKEQAKADRLYWIEIFLSGTIASLGLLLNSVAVIIGAMLIAPFLRPINGIAFGIARGERKNFTNLIKVLILSSVISILTGFMVMNITGLYKETTEILARTSPNIIDLFIAIFSAMVALLSLRYKRLGESVAGVAMAAALMPPLGVIGMELALGNYSSAWGATMLFIANIFAIILVGIGAFWLYGFTPNDGGKQKKAFVRILLVIFLISIISIPLFQNLSYLKEREFIETKTKVYLSEILSNKISNFKIDKISVKELSNKKVKLSTVIKINQGVKFYDEFEKYIDKELTEKFGRDTQIEIELIVVANKLSKEKEKEANIKQTELQKKLEAQKSKEQEEYIKNLKKDFEKELGEKLKKEIDVKFKKEFNFILEKRLLEQEKLNKTGTGEITTIGKIIKEDEKS